MSSAYALSTMLDKYDIDLALLSEHKLMTHSESFLDSIHSKYTYYATTDATVDQYSRVSCGKGGTAILYKKSINRIVSHIENISSNRIVGVRIETQHGTHIAVMCVYMPSSNSRDAYFETLSELQSLVTFYLQDGPVIVSGDFNAQLCNADSHNFNFKSKALVDFIRFNNMNPINVTRNTTGPLYSFVPNRTMIDHLLADSMVDIGHFKIIDETDMVITSDHLPSLCSINVTTKTAETPDSNRVCIAWHKITLQNICAYQCHLRQNIDNQRLHEMSVNELANTITSAMLESADCNIPKSKFNKFTKPYWTTAVKEAHARSRQLRQIWINEGRPRGRQSTSYVNYKYQKNVFRNIQRAESQTYQRKIHDDLDAAADTDYKLFWRLLHQRKPRKRCVCNEIIVNNERFHPADNVADGFSKYFADIFSDSSDVPSSTSEPDIRAQLAILKAANAEYTIDSLDREVTADEVAKLIKQLKLRKAPGNDNIQNEHMINGGETIIHSLVTLFNKIIAAQTIPDNWRGSIIIPLYKGSGKPRTDPNSYRPISLISCMSKIFERLILDRINDYIRSQAIKFPCNEQQGFQKGLSCMTASFNLQESIYYNLEMGCNVFVAFLDVQKAFDSVWHDALFVKLHSLGIAGKIWNVLVNSYTDLKCNIRMNGAISKPLIIKRGVRQGGVISTFLYLVFIDELLNQLQQSGHGAHVCSIPAGNPTLADDISCIATSPASLQSMMDIVSRYTQQFRFTVNVRKSCVLMYTNTRIVTKPDIRLGETSLILSESTMHLGIRQSQNTRSKARTSECCQKGKNAFFALLTLGVKPLGLNPITSANLYRKIIIPSVLYGCELWNHLTQSEIDELNRLQHFIVKKIQGFKIRTRSDICESMLGLYRLTSEIDKRKMMFLHKILTSPTETLSQTIFIRRLLLFRANPTVVRYGFVPDILAVLMKYGLTDIITNFLENPLNVPGKYAWKVLVRGAVINKETDLWSARLHSDDTFCRFRSLHSEIKPAIVWTLPQNFHELKVCDTVARLWTEVPSPTLSICPNCELMVGDYVIHIIADCQLVMTRKSGLLSDIRTTFGIELHDELHSASSETFTEKVMGAELMVSLDDELIRQYQLTAFNYVAQCVEICS